MARAISARPLLDGVPTKGLYIWMWRIPKNLIKIKEFLVLFMIVYSVWMGCSVSFSNTVFRITNSETKYTFGLVNLEIWNCSSWNCILFLELQIFELI